ncbi:DUF4097 family beta strand repeat-containing protein [Streptomyces sp. NPDC004126]|uniref:DUF4097 family beta strand repeat-containing protein n=1 Tax=Streptomyces sp. NPDC004126 TaxID=3390695 RepID=UPI003D02CE1F
MQKFDTPVPVSAVLDVPAARIRLAAADRTDTTVEVLPADASSSRDIKAAQEAEVAYGEGVLRITAPAARNQLLGSSGRLDVTVHLPAGSRVEAKAADAELRSTGRLGEVVFDAARAAVELDETGSARLTLQSGDVSVARLGGPAEIRTQKGDLRVGEAVGGTVVLSTEHGNITVAAAPGVSASLDAGTGYGRIDNTLNNTAGADAALNIRATTAHGDITARGL